MHVCLLLVTNFECQLMFERCLLMQKQSVLLQLSYHNLMWIFSWKAAPSLAMELTFENQSKQWMIIDYFEKFKTRKVFLLFLYLYSRYVCPTDEFFRCKMKNLFTILLVSFILWWNEKSKKSKSKLNEFDLSLDMSWVMDLQFWYFPVFWNWALIISQANFLSLLSISIGCRTNLI